MRTLVAAGLVAGVGGCERTRAADPVILALGEQSVRRSDFEAHCRRLESQGGAPLEAPVRAALLDSYLETRVLVLEARARGLLAADAGEAEERGAVQRLLEAEVTSKLSVSEAEIEAEAGRAPSPCAVPERRVLRQILLPNLNEARDVRRRLERDPRAFEILARSRSRAPEAIQGGLMGRFARGELPPDLEGAAFALPAGATSAILETALGFHILRVESVEPAGSRPPAECRTEIEGRLLRLKSDREVREFVRSLLARAKVNHEAATAAGSAS